MFHILRSANRFNWHNFARKYAIKPAGKESIKTLAKKYGKTAIGVYTAICLIDLPLSFCFVHSMGPDVLQDYEQRGRKILGMKSEIEDTFVHKKVKAGKSMFWTEFAIAYIMHRSLIVIRTPLTIFLTPRISSKLQKWGLAKVMRPSPEKYKLGYIAPNLNRVKDLKK